MANFNSVALVSGAAQGIGFACAQALSEDGAFVILADMDWPTLRDAILKAHRAIEDMFFQGHGNHLQYIDSCIAEQVMLQFNKMDYPVLPVHDSFIMHHAFGDLGELEEAMRRAFYHHFKKDIRVKGEIGELMAGSFDGRDSDELSFDELIDGEPEYSRWNGRN